MFYFRYLNQELLCVAYGLPDVLVDRNQTLLAINISAALLTKLVNGNLSCIVVIKLVNGNLDCIVIIKLINGNLIFVVVIKLIKVI